MDNKKIIFGVLGLAVVGGVAYFYFKSKSKKTPAQNLMDTLSSSSASSTTSTSSTSNTQSQSNQGTKLGDKVLDNAPVTNAQAQANQQETAKQIQAQGLANQISSLKSQFASLQSAVPSCFYPSFGSNSTDFSNYNKCVGFRTQILDIQSRMKDLGYKEDNGLAVKI